MSSPRSFTYRARRALATSVLSLPDRVVARLAGPPVVRDGNTLDPQLQLMLKLAHATGVKHAHAVPLAKARRELDASAQMLEPEPAGRAETRDVDLPGPAGRIRARTYRPLGVSDGAPCLVYFHGGGWALGSLDSVDAPCRALATGAGCVVVSVDYRLAPEHRFPAAADDATAALRAIVADPGRFGIDPARVAVGGDSAGGNLSAVVCLDTKDDAVRPCAQLLVYPGVDMTMSFPTIRTLAHGFFLEKETMDWFLDQYVPNVADRSTPRASPFFAPSHAGLPRAFVATAGFDPLRDEGRAYATKLTEAGVRCEERCYGSLIHGFLNTSGVIRAARAPLADMIAFLRSAFGDRA